MLALEFANGDCRRFESFERVRVDHRTVLWAGETDVAAETLYDDSIPLTRGPRDLVTQHP